MFKQEPSQLQRLDWMLGHFAKHAGQGLAPGKAWDDLKVLHPTMHIEGNESYFTQIIDKLAADGYIKFYTNGYWITFEGLIFHQAGGYVERQSKDENRSRFEDAGSFYIQLGSLLAGAGACVLLLFEFSKLTHIQKYVFLIFFFSGCAGMGLGYLLGRQMPRKSRE